MSLLYLVLGFLGTSGIQEAGEWPVTRAERTEYRETSSHADVMAFLDALRRAGGDFVLESLGTSTGGRDIPLVVISRHPRLTPSQAQRSGKPIVYVQANIHGGEVEGKEVALMLLRELARGDADHLLDAMTLLVCPVYNCDGNDAFGPGDRQRPNDNGPDPVGLRPNGMGLDLNRDCVKAESPEMRGVLDNVYRRWDPDVILDLHTTNGTRHGYALTYSPPLGPDTESGVLEFTRDVLLPEVRKRVRAQHGIELFDYGNTRPRREPTGWYTFEPHPRYVTNYAGLRNRIGILSEATSYLPFKERVDATRHFLREVLERVAAEGARVVAVTRQADARVTSWGVDPAKAPELGVRFEHASRGTETVLLENPSAEREAMKPVDIVNRDLAVYDRFRATRTARLPMAYLIPSSYPEVAELLTRHGVVVERVTEATRCVGFRFLVEALNTSEFPMQGHRLHQLDGKWEEVEEAEVSPGTFVVRTAQPLGVLIFHLLEAESPDGVTAWGFLDRGLRKGRPHPIRKVGVPTSFVARRVDSGERGR